VTQSIDISGLWKGSYFYDQGGIGPSDGLGVGFELRLRQVWWQRAFGRFSGTVRDDPDRGMPGEGRVDGSAREGAIRITKRMPFMYLGHGGQRVPVREYLRDQGLDPGRDIAHRPILYEGKFDAAGRAGGTWRIAAGVLRVTSHVSLRLQECTGTWTLGR
jgi:hypothetical protein